MMILAVMLLGVVVVELAAIIGILWSIYERQDLHTEQLTEIKRLQLNPRTRMKRARLRNKPVELEDRMARAGRIAAPQRRVVGGDKDSELNRNLARVKGVDHDG